MSTTHVYKPGDRFLLQVEGVVTHYYDNLIEVRFDGSTLTNGMHPNVMKNSTVYLPPPYEPQVGDIVKIKNRPGKVFLITQYDPFCVGEPKYELNSTEWARSSVLDFVYRPEATS